MHNFIHKTHTVLYSVKGQTAQQVQLWLAKTRQGQIESAAGRQKLKRRYRFGWLNKDLVGQARSGLSFDGSLARCR